jgi:uncharacterized LabA/DUF88 family protein
MDKIAVLIDGGYFLKRLPQVCQGVETDDSEAVTRAIGRLVVSHLKNHNKIIGKKHARSNLYRVFYYDATPYQDKAHLPVSRKAIDYSRTEEARFRSALFDCLRRNPNTAVRLGEVRKERGWVLKEGPQKELLSGKKSVGDLEDDDFAYGLRQKAVDMKIGLDIASLTLKRQVGHIVLVAGDADFVPAAKLARREGVRIILDPLWRRVAHDLFEHIDMLYSGFKRPSSKTSA